MSAAGHADANPGSRSDAPVVSIIVIAHSVRDELERCFAAIAEHARMPVQTILIDNASTDDTLAWVDQAHPEVEVVTLDRNMGAAARQHGLDRVRGRYAMFLDSDAALTDGALPTMVDALETHPDWGLIAPRIVHDDGSLQLSIRRFPPLLLPVLRRPPLDRFFESGSLVQRHLMADADHTRTRPVLYAIGACQLFRTSLARRAGSFDERVFLGWSDADWCLRIRDAGGEVIYLPAATVIHSYRRKTRRDPVSLAALKMLTAHVRFQWQYRGRRRELVRLAEQLDRRAAG